MRRFLSLVALVAVIGLLALGGTFRHTDAQDATPAALAGHPLIGAWLLDTDSNDPANAPSLVIFHDDGTYVQADADGSNGIGTWEATGATSAALTALYLGRDESGGFGGTVKVRATIELDASGETFTAQYTLDFLDLAGASSGEIGPGTATAERIAVEPMGTPAAELPRMNATPTS